MNPEDDNTYCTGLGLQLYWPVFFKRKGIIAWNKLNDRFGSPTPWGKYPRNAGPKEKGTLFDALRAISNDGVVMTPEGMQIELLESKLTGSVSTQESLCNFMDDWIAEVLLGQEPRTSGGGALAAASKERTAVRLDLVQADSDLLSDTLNNTLIRWICEYNGLAPCLVYRVIAEEEDLKASSETDKNVSEMGFELNLDAVRAKYGEGWEKKAPAPAQPPALPGRRPATVPVVDNEESDGEAQESVAETQEGATASFAEPGERDAIDDAVDEALVEWEEVITPITDPVLAAIADAADAGETAEQVLQRISALLAAENAPDAGPLAERLAQLAGAARLAGAAGADA
jgi:phage gp29-like protein